MLVVDRKKKEKNGTDCFRVTYSHLSTFYIDSIDSDELIQCNNVHYITIQTLMYYDDDLKN